MTIVELDVVHLLMADVIIFGMVVMVLSSW
jgi:hypothetical protein